MKYLLTLLLPFLASCQVLEQVKTMQATLDKALEDDRLDRKELEVLDEKTGQLAETLEDLEENAFTVGELAAGGGGITAFGMAALHYLRNRKYRQPRTVHETAPGDFHG